MLMHRRFHLGHCGCAQSMLLAADYEGCLSLWDAEVNACTGQYEEHVKRVWSADFSQVRGPARALLHLAWALLMESPQGFSPGYLLPAQPPNTCWEMARNISR